jgi:hypothetical protein
MGMIVLACNIIYGISPYFLHHPNHPPRSMGTKEVAWSFLEGYTAA